MKEYPLIEQTDKNYDIYAARTNQEESSGNSERLLIDISRNKERHNITEMLLFVNTE